MDMTVFLIIVVIVAIVLAIWFIKVYNRLQALMQEIREGYANLQANLKKREQLNSQMIDIASKYMEHEQLMQLQIAQRQGNMSQMRFIAQDFPDLRANETYQTLMGQLEKVEDEILNKRESYNKRVKYYNATRSSFPTILIASKLSFDAVDYFNTDDDKFDMQAAKFAKDDSEALKKMIDSGVKSVGDTAGRAVKQINKGVSKGVSEAKKIIGKEDNGIEPDDENKV